MNMQVRQYSYRTTGLMDLSSQNIDDIKTAAVGCHGNHAFSYIPNRLIFKNGLVSNLGGPNEQFGTHEKLSWGARNP